MTVYILEQDHGNGSLNRLTAKLGFSQMGEEVIEYSAEGFDDLALTREDIVVGGIGYVRRVFERLGWGVPDLLPIPPQLEPFAGRRLWRADMADVRRRVDAGERFFVKPAPHQPKLFTGRVIGAFADLIATAHLPGDLVVDCAEPVNFVSEFRTFVLHGDVLSARGSESH